MRLRGERERMRAGPDVPTERGGIASERPPPRRRFERERERERDAGG